MATGRPNTFCDMKSTNAGEAPAIGLSPVMPFVSPATNVAMPSVATMDGTLNTSTSTAFTAPIASATSTTTASAARKGQPRSKLRWTSRAVVTDTTAPSERSNSPASSTSTAASVTSRSVACEPMMIFAVCDVRNVGSAAVK